MSLTLGTFAVGRGEGLTWGTPPCLGDLTEAEMVGFIKPYIQFGRSTGVPLYGIASSVMSDVSFGRIKVATSEFNTASLIVTLEDYSASAPSSTAFVKLYQEDSTGNLVLLENGFNTFVIEDLSIDLSAEGASARGDARLFKFPNGQAGVFIERTGQFFELEEIRPTFDIFVSKVFISTIAHRLLSQNSDLNIFILPHCTDPGPTHV